MRNKDKKQKTNKKWKIGKEARDMLVCLQQKIMENNDKLDNNMLLLNYKMNNHCDIITHNDFSQIRNYSDEITKFMHKMQRCFNNVKKDIDVLILKEPKMNDIININNNDRQGYLQSLQTSNHSYYNLPKTNAQISFCTSNNQQIANQKNTKNSRENIDNSPFSLYLYDTAESESESKNDNEIQSVEYQYNSNMFEVFLFFF